MTKDERQGGFVYTDTFKPTGTALHGVSLDLIFLGFWVGWKAKWWMMENEEGVLDSLWVVGACFVEAGWTGAVLFFDQPDSTQTTTRFNSNTGCGAGKNGGLWCSSVAGYPRSFGDGVWTGRA